VNAAAKDAELYLRRCRKLESVIADLLAALDEIAALGDVDCDTAPQFASAAIAQARGAL
jgi:hypothetical protein